MFDRCFIQQFYFANLYSELRIMSLEINDEMSIIEDDWARRLSTFCAQLSVLVDGYASKGINNIIIIIFIINHL